MGNRTSSTHIPLKSETFDKTTVFRQNDPPGITYRIPGLVYFKENQTYLAFAEKRTSSSDHDAKLLVMRRGILGKSTVEWSPVQELEAACMPKHRTMNPCPVLERDTQTLFLFFICVLGTTTERHQICTGKNAARLCYISSSDYGHNWTELIDLTDGVIGKHLQRWATFAVGPGHGIQTKNGRLIVPAYTFYIHHKCFCLPCVVKPHVLAFYSDDLGKTWQMGAVMQKKSCECEMAEVLDQDNRSFLYCNARTTCGHRIEAISEDNGVEFAQAHLAKELVEQPHGCQGSVIAIDVSTHMSKVGKEETWLLYSHPTDRRRRRDLGMYLNRSPLHSSQWETPQILHQGPSGYSDMAYCEDRDLVACLMECGKETELEQIAFVMIDIKNVI